MRMRSSMASDHLNLLRGGGTGPQRVSWVWSQVARALCCDPFWAAPTDARQAWTDLPPRQRKPSANLEPEARDRACRDRIPRATAISVEWRLRSAPALRRT